jgi:hypothetical protein
VQFHCCTFSFRGQKDFSSCDGFKMIVSLLQHRLQSSLEFASAGGFGAIVMAFSPEGSKQT